MKQLLTGFFALFVLHGILQAQPFTLSGRVLDKDTKEPLFSATIGIVNPDKRILTGTFTKADGFFSLSVMQATGKTIRLQATYIGYKAKLVKLTARNHQDIVILLEKIPIVVGPPVVTYTGSLPPVEVRAVRASAKAPFSKTELRAAAIEKNNLGQDIPFLLNQTPSVVINSDAGNGIGYTGIRIRGTDATRINMTINGIPYNDAESQGIFFVNLPDFASSVNSLQIQRGVGGSTNGAGAFGATLSFSTTSNNPVPFAEVNNSFGSFNSRKHTVKAGTGTLRNGFSVEGRASHISSDGFIDRASSRLQSYFLSTTWQNNRSSIRFNIISGNEKTYQAWYGIPEGKLTSDRSFNAAGTEKPGEPYNNETDNYKQDHYQLLVNHEFSNSIVMNLTSFLTQGAGYYEQYKAAQKYSRYGLPNPVIGGVTLTATDLVRRLWLDNDFYGQTVSLLYNKRKTSLTYGGAWSRYKGLHFGEIAWAQYGINKDYRWYNYPAQKNDITNFLKWEEQIAGRFTLYADIQYRHVNYRISGFRNNPGVAVNKSWNFINPKTGISYLAENGTTASLSYALANKEPNRDDFEAGLNEQPKHETLHDAELNISGKAGKTTWLKGTLYYMAYRNQLILTGRINDVGAYTRQNVPVSYRAGIELQATQTLNKWGQVNASLALSRNKIRSFSEFIDDYDNGGQKKVAHSDEDIALSPAAVGAVTLTITKLKNLEINLLEKYVSRQHLDNTQDKARSLNPFFVQDVLLNYRLPIKQLKECRILLQVNNLFGRRYEPNGYTFSYYYGGQLTTENYYFPMAGRNFMAGVNVKL